MSYELALATPASTRGLARPQQRARAHGSRALASRTHAPAPAATATAAPQPDWQLTLVNAHRPLPRGWRPQLSTFAGGQRIDRRVLAPAQLMLIACHKAGLKPHVTSAWRSRPQQAWLFARRAFGLMRKGHAPLAAIRLTRRFVALPGTSEHELGLALDINAASGTPQDNAAVHAWLANNAWRHGFVCRYPAAKSHLTGVAGEPWHVRYVGKEAARTMHANGLCLEEYVALRGRA